VPRISLGTGSLESIMKDTGSLPTAEELVLSASKRRNAGRFEVGGFRPVGMDISKTEAVAIDKQILSNAGVFPGRLAVLRENCIIVKVNIAEKKMSNFLHKAELSVYRDITVDIVSTTVNDLGEETFNVVLRGNNQAAISDLMHNIISDFDAIPEPDDYSFLSLGIGAQSYPLNSDEEYYSYESIEHESEASYHAGGSIMEMEVLRDTAIEYTVKKRPTLVVPICDIFPEDLSLNDLNLHLEKINDQGGLAAVLSSKQVKAKLVDGFLYISAAAERFTVDLLKIASDLLAILPLASIQLCEIEMREIEDKFAVRPLNEFNVMPGKIFLTPAIDARLSGKHVYSRDNQHLKEYNTFPDRQGYVLDSFKIRPTLKFHPVTGQGHNRIIQALNAEIRHSSKTIFTLHGPAGSGKSTVVSNLSHGMDDVDFMIACYRDFNAGIPGASLKDIYSEICDYVEDLIRTEGINMFQESSLLVKEFRDLGANDQRKQFQGNASLFVSNIAKIFTEIDNFLLARGKCGVFVLEDLHFSDPISHANLTRALDQYLSTLRNEQSRLKFIFTGREKIEFSSKNGLAGKRKDMGTNTASSYGLDPIEFAVLGSSELDSLAFDVNGKTYLIQTEEVDSFVRNYFVYKVDEELGLSDYTSVDIESFGRLLFCSGGNPAHANDLLQDALSQNAIHITEGGMLIVIDEYLRILKNKSLIELQGGILREVYEAKFEQLSVHQQKILLIINLVGEIPMNDLWYLMIRLDLNDHCSFDMFLDKHIEPLQSQGLLLEDSKHRVKIARSDYVDSLNTHFSKRDIGNMAFLLSEVAGNILGDDTTTILNIRAFNGLIRNDFRIEGREEELNDQLEKLSAMVDSLYERGQFSLLAKYIFENPLLDEILQELMNLSAGSNVKVLGIDYDVKLVDLVVKCLAYGLMSYVMTSDFRSAEKIIVKYSPLMAKVDDFANKVIVNSNGSIADHPITKYAFRYFAGVFMHNYLISSDKKMSEQQVYLEEMRKCLNQSGETYGHNLLYVYYLYRFDGESCNLPEDIVVAINQRLLAANMECLGIDENTRDFVNRVFSNKSILVDFCNFKEGSSMPLLNEGLRLIARSSMDRSQAALDKVSGMDDRVSYLCFDESLAMHRIGARARVLLLEGILKEAMDSPANMTGTTMLDFIWTKLELEALSISNMEEAAVKYPELAIKYIGEMYERARTLGNDKKAVIACNMAARSYWMSLVADAKSQGIEFSVSDQDFDQLFLLKDVEIRAAEKLGNDSLDKRIAYQDLLYFTATYIDKCKVDEMSPEAKITYLKALSLLDKALGMILDTETVPMKIKTNAAYADWSLLFVIIESVARFQSRNKKQLPTLLKSLGIDSSFLLNFIMRARNVLLQMKQPQFANFIEQALIDVDAYQHDLDGAVQLRKSTLLHLNQK
jgi:hypothetical protein